MCWGKRKRQLLHFLPMWYYSRLPPRPAIFNDSWAFFFSLDDALLPLTTVGRMGVGGGNRLDEGGEGESDEDDDVRTLDGTSLQLDWR